MSELQPQDLGNGKTLETDVWTDIILGKDSNRVKLTEDSCLTCQEQLIHHNDIMVKLTTNQRRFHKIAEKNEKKLKEEISTVKA